jgi:hypothetical protein
MKQFTTMCIVLGMLLSCGGQTIKSPASVLQETGQPSFRHITAMEMLDEQVGIADAQYKVLLQRMLWSPGYTNDARHEALRRLYKADKDETIRNIRQQLPRLENWTWLTALCEWIADEEIHELEEALISSWSIPNALFRVEVERPEYLALVKLVGEDEILDTIFESLVSSNKAWKQGYRTRCWELLHRLAERERLVDLLSSEQIASDDSFLLDLKKAMVDFGIVPHRREEILWIRELAKPEYEDFWNEGIATLQELDNERRSDIEMRDLPIAVSLRRHSEPGDLSRTTEEIIREISSKIRNQKHYYEQEGGGSFDARNELLATHTHRLTWGDAIAMEIALKALEVPQVRSHIFEYADRDYLDKTTEYGGVIALDKKGRFEILEFEPEIRHHDRRFNASQDMFDAAYTALFHFHFHAQERRNGDHAGPGLGDKNYATNTRANCLVFTFVNKDSLNVDYYRHHDVVVDLGTISRN